MPDPILAPEKPPRRRQEDRREQARRRLIDATISCLYRLGYNGTTITKVAAEAGMSRGMIGYHFASKAELMVAVRDTVWRDEQTVLSEHEARFSARELIRQMPHLLLATSRSKASIAVDVIKLAARGDPELQSKLKATEREIDQFVMDRQPELFARAGLDLPPEMEALVHLTVAAVRGLVQAELVRGEEADVEACIELYGKLTNEIFGFTD